MGIAAILCLCLGDAALADEGQPGLRLSVMPSADLPLYPDGALFDVSGGVAVGGAYVLPPVQTLATGVRLGYHRARVDHPDVDGALAIFSAQATAEMRLTLGAQIEAFATAGGGSYYAFEEGDLASSARGWVASAALGAGLRLSPLITVGAQAEYQQHARLYHHLAIGLMLDFHRSHER